MLLGKEYVCVRDKCVSVHNFRLPFSPHCALCQPAGVSVSCTESLFLFIPAAWNVNRSKGLDPDGCLLSAQNARSKCAVRHRVRLYPLVFFLTLFLLPTVLCLFFPSCKKETWLDSCFYDDAVSYTYRREPAKMLKDKGKLHYDLLWQRFGRAFGRYHVRIYATLPTVRTEKDGKGGTRKTTCM